MYIPDIQHVVDSAGAAENLAAGPPTPSVNHGATGPLLVQTNNDVTLKIIQL
jgi:hypothetical protein